MHKGRCERNRGIGLFLATALIMAGFLGLVGCEKKASATPTPTITPTELVSTPTCACLASTVVTEIQAGQTADVRLYRTILPELKTVLDEEVANTKATTNAIQTTIATLSGTPVPEGTPIAGN